MVEHSPLPFSLKKHGRMPNGVKMFWLNPATSIGTTNDNDATFVETACNCHYDLVEALKVCADELQVEVEDRWGKDPRVAHKLKRDLAPVERARAAIAKARGHD
mgnify:CR=1 FL=1